MKASAVRVQCGVFALPDKRVFVADVRSPSGFSCRLKEGGVFECYWDSACDETIVIGSDGKVAGVAHLKKERKVKYPHLHGTHADQEGGVMKVKRLIRVARRCPFCGGTKVLPVVDTDTHYWAMVCEECKAQGPATQDSQRVFNLWNKLTGAKRVKARTS